MLYQRDNTILSFSDAKTPALFFDYVIPLLYFPEYTDFCSLKNIYESILPDPLKSKSGILGLSNIYEKHFENTLLKAESNFNFNVDGSVSRENLVPTVLDVCESHIALLKTTKINPTNIYDPSLYTSTKGEKCDPCLILSNLEFVDAQNTEWEQIIEIRKDKKSWANLRNIRLFIYKNYNDKPISFIEDDILMRIEKYERTVKRWGFKTLNSALKLCMSEKNITNLGIFTGSTFFGVPIKEAIAIGASVTIGNILIDLSNNTSQFVTFKENDPIRYLVDLKSNGILSNG